MPQRSSDEEGLTKKLGRAVLAGPIETTLKGGEGNRFGFGARGHDDTQLPAGAVLLPKHSSWEKAIGSRRPQNAGLVFMGSKDPQHASDALEFSW